MTCPRCGAPVTPGDRFCADCGVRLADPGAASPGSRTEALGPDLAGHTDPGRTHPANQDAFALSRTADGAVAVLCDGVSQSQTPELAAAVAAHVAHDTLAAATGPRDAAMREAIRQAHAAVCALPFDRQATLDPPATTLVAAWLHPAGITLGWLGDSRAYALGAAGALLTRDHSWLRAVVDRGEMTEAAASRDRRAHALVQCLGTTDFGSATPCPEPGILECPPGEGWLLLCSDGLWNYAETPAALALAAGQGLQGDAAELCARLVAFALASGGRDNITVVALRRQPA